MQDLLLLQNPDVRSQAMSLAHSIREETGADMSEALSEAWSELSNPGEGNPKVKKAVKKAVEDVGTSGLLLLAGAGLIIYKLVKREWPWQTWQLGQMKKKAIEEAQRIALAAKSKPQEHHSVAITIIPNDRTQETVQMILP